MRALVRLFLPSTNPFEIRYSGKKEKNARISSRQLRKAERASRISEGPSFSTLAIQQSKPAAALDALAVKYQLLKSSFKLQACATSGNCSASFAHSPSCSAVKSSFACLKSGLFPFIRSLASLVAQTRLRTEFRAFSTC